MFSHPNFFVSDVAEYRQNVAAQADGKKMPAFFPDWDPHTWQVRHLFIALATLSPAPESLTRTHGTFRFPPYKFGEANAKFRVVPDPGSCPAYSLPAQNRELPNFLRKCAVPAVIDRSDARVLRLANTAAGPRQVHADRGHQY